MNYKDKPFLRKIGWNVFDKNTEYTIASETRKNTGNENIIHITFFDDDHVYQGQTTLVRSEDIPMQAIIVQAREQWEEEKKVKVIMYAKEDREVAMMKALRQIFINSVVSYDQGYRGQENWDEACDSAYQAEEFLGFSFEERIDCPNCGNHAIYKVNMTGLYNCLSCDTEGITYPKPEEGE